MIECKAFCIHVTIKRHTHMRLPNYNSSKIRKRQDAKEATPYIIYTVPLHQLTNV